MCGQQMKKELNSFVFYMYMYMYIPAGFMGLVWKTFLCGSIVTKKFILV